MTFAFAAAKVPTICYGIGISTYLVCPNSRKPKQIRNISKQGFVRRLALDVSCKHEQVVVVVDLNSGLKRT